MLMFYVPQNSVKDGSERGLWESERGLLQEPMVEHIWISK